MFKQILASSALIASAVAAYSNDTVVTTDVTVTDYTTYCPYSTVVTITKCDEVCAPTVITVTEATTLTVTGECIVPTTYSTTTEEVTSTVVPPTTVAGESTTPSSVAPAVSSFEGAGNKVAAGAFAGVAAIAAALV